MSTINREGEGIGPSIEDLQRFDQSSLGMDPKDDKHFHQWAQSAQVLSDKGWKPEEVIGRLWTLRPDFRTPGLAEEDAAKIVTDEQKPKPAPDLRPASMDEVRFHASMIQTAALTGETVVFRGERFTMEGLPSHIFPTNPLRPFYIDEVHLAAELMRPPLPPEKGD